MSGKDTVSSQQSRDKSKERSARYRARKSANASESEKDSDREQATFRKQKSRSISASAPKLQTYDEKEEARIRQKKCRSSAASTTESADEIQSKKNQAKLRKQMSRAKATCRVPDVEVDCNSEESSSDGANQSSEGINRTVHVSESEAATHSEQLNGRSTSINVPNRQTRDEKADARMRKQRSRASAASRAESADEIQSKKNQAKLAMQKSRAKTALRVPVLEIDSTASEGSDENNQSSDDNRGRRPPASNNNLCPFCGEKEHHLITTVTSCPNYCSYCLGFGHTVRGCKFKSADDLRSKNMSKDAANYKRAVEQTMFFYTCAVCETEAGLDTMVELASVLDLIAKSGIKSMFGAMIQPLHEHSASPQEKAFAAAAKNELKDGLLKDASHVCKTCVSALKKGNPKRNKQTSTNDAENTFDDNHTLSNVPTLALVNGHFRGKCPMELACLTRTEVSLVTLINVCANVSMLRGGGHWGSQGTVFSVLNDVAEVAAFLPMNPTPAQHAIIRKGTTASPKDYRYNPFRVLRAMRWLEENNELYHNKTAAVVLLDDGTPDPNWLGQGIDQDLEPDHIEASDDDFEGIEEHDPAGDDGHAVNPGAPPSSMTNVFLQGGQAFDSNIHQINAIVSGAPPPVVTVRQNGEFVRDYETDHFMAKAFPVLYPYGKGAPSQFGFKYNAAYVSHVLHLGGDRSFQQNPTFLFYSYAWVIRNKVGTISYLASSKEDFVAEELTVQEVQTFLANLKADPYSGGITTAEQRSLLNRLQPFASQVPGTEIYFEKERKNLLTMISSPVTTTEGQWTWFFTEAQPDKYLAEIFDNAITSAREALGTGIGASLAERQNRSRLLTSGQRAEILRDHPFLSARIHGLQQKAFWECVLQGADKPLGEIADFWLRVEFQMKGTPHWHTLINILKRSLKGIDKFSIESIDASVRQRVLDFVQSVSTSKLVPRDGDNCDDLVGDTTGIERWKETEYEFNVKGSKYFDDAKHPSRYHFGDLKEYDQIDGEEIDYARNSATDQIRCTAVRKRYRRLQLANQMHLCRNSCYKYCNKNGRQKCRYDFPRVPIAGNSVAPVILKDKDKRNRPRIKVHSARNNANINNCLQSPVCVLATRGNHDIQFIQNVRGGAEYCSKYASKVEAAETNALQNAINRKLAKYINEKQILPSMRSKLGIVANAVVEAQQVGAVQACYLLGKQKLVLCSRGFVHINTLKRNLMTHHPVITDEDELAQMDNNASALKVSPSTQMGKRDAYHAYCVQQDEAYGVVHVGLTYYAFVASYQTLALPNETTQRTVAPQVLLDEHGFIKNPKSFVIEDVVYSAMRKKSVVCLSPHMPIDETKESSAYAILLMYSNWGLAGEDDILMLNGVEVAATVKLQSVKETLPEFVKVSLKQQQTSQALLADAGDGTLDSADLSDPEFGSDAEETALHVPTRVGLIAGVAPKFSTERFVRNAPVENIVYLHNYVESVKGAFKNRDSAKRQLSEAELLYKQTHPHAHYDIHDVDAEREALAIEVAQLNIEQRRAYDIAVEHISGAAGKQMIMFLSGEGGTGKSKVIHTITRYTRILFGRTEGEWGAVLKTAPTGGAAHNIGGSTWHSALGNDGRKQLKVGGLLSNKTVTNLQRKATGTELYVLDELSLLSCDNIFEIDRRLKAATNKPGDWFGGLHVILAGDFYQMRTMNGIPLVQQNISSDAKHKEAVIGRRIFTTEVTHYCELIQNVRAQLNSQGTLAPLAKFTQRARIGDVTAQNGVLAILNDRVVNTYECAMRKALPGAVWITSTHAKIAEINDKFEREHLKHGHPLVQVIARHTPLKLGTAMPDIAMRKTLYSEVGDRSGGRNKLMVSYMNLFVGTRVRLTRNMFVEGGLYNGAMGTVWGFVFKNAGPGIVLQAGDKLQFCEMEDEDREIPVVLVQMDGDDDSFPSCSPTVPRLIPICETESMCTVQGHYRRYQIPLLPAQARTAHSVQGYTARDGVVVDPGSQFFAGDYTAISRATDKEKVLLLRPLVPENFNCDTRHREYQILVEQEYKRLRQLF